MRHDGGHEFLFCEERIKVRLHLEHVPQGEPADALGWRLDPKESREVLRFGERFRVEQVSHAGVGVDGGAKLAVRSPKLASRLQSCPEVLVGL